MKNPFFSILLLSLLLFSCSNKQEKKNDAEENVPETMLSLLLSGKTGIDFNNELSATADNNILSYEYYYNGSGVSVGDINNDGLVDVFFTGSNVDNKLYLNKGNLAFEDISKKAGIEKHQALATGVTMIDINNDSWLDIYICQSGKFTPEKRANLLYINNKNNTFTESAKSYGLNDMSFSTQSCFFDYDKDGDLDVYIVNHPVDFDNANFLIQSNKNNTNVSDRLYKNNGNNTFTDVTEKAGIINYAFGLSVSAADINKDGWPDIYIGNDYIEPDFLYINNHNGTFTESLKKYMKHCSDFTMGNDIADFNNDGLMDIITVDMIPESNKRQKKLKGGSTYDTYQTMVENGFHHQYMRNMLQLNNGNGTYSEIGQLAGISNTDWSWSPLFADIDNDGLKDILITNGYRRDITNLDYNRYTIDSILKTTGRVTFQTVLEALKQIPSNKMQNYIYKNNGNLTFTKKTEEWGFGEPSFSNGGTYADLDNDGDLDIIINNIDMPAFIYKNNSRELTKNNYLDVVFKNSQEKNDNGIGASVKITANTVSQYQLNCPTRGFQSTIEAKVHFGLNTTSTIEELEVTWPDGTVQILQNVKANQVLTLDRKNATKKNSAIEKIYEGLFIEEANASGINYKHTENNFIDFKREPLLPQKFSEEGPCLAVGDVNNDGTDDFFVGGAAGFSGAMYIQSKEGKFTKINSPDLNADKLHEDVDALFFDVDKDGDKDLYVASGGNEFIENSPNYQGRLYINNGRGYFTRKKDALPTMNTSSSCLAAGDYDDDGDLDLFVGGRILSGKYPISPRSYILQNNAGKFSDATTAVCKGLETPGLVCDAIWTDFNNDKKLDLIVVGQWMQITMLKNIGKTFENVGLQMTNGWWNCIAECDLDSDGDMDYVVGNLGLNSRIKATDLHPAFVVANDFDNNGSTDAVMSIFFGDKSYPIHQRDQLLDQVRDLRKKYLRYESYSNATIYDIFPKQKVDSSLVLLSKNFATSIVENLGNGSFKMTPLPIEAQFSPTNGIVCRDFNNDGKIDILLAGNSYAPEIETGRYDAGTGLLLIGNGKTGFSPVKIKESGFFADKNVQSMKMLLSAKTGKELILVGNNNDRLQLFRKR